MHLQANYIDNATKQKQELLQRHKGLLSATVQAEMVVSGLQEALKEMCISNKGVSHSFRSRHSFLVQHEIVPASLGFIWKRLRFACSSAQRPHALCHAFPHHSKGPQAFLFLLHPNQGLKGLLWPDDTRCSHSNFDGLTVLHMYDAWHVFTHLTIEPCIDSD